MSRPMAALLIAVSMAFSASAAQAQVVTRTSPWNAWAWGPGGVWSSGTASHSPLTPTPVYPVLPGGAWAAPYVPPYSYYAAVYPYPARIYIGYFSNDMPFYGTPYGHPYDLWTWPEMRRLSYYIVP